MLGLLLCAALVRGRRVPRTRRRHSPNQAQARGSARGAEANLVLPDLATSASAA